MNSRSTRQHRKSPILLAAILGLVATVHASAQSLAFDVTTIRPHKSDNPQQIRTMVMNPTHRGQFMASDVSLRTLIQIAYGVQENQVTGGPDWVSGERFDIQAKAESSVDDTLAKMSDGDATLAKQAMLQAMLKDRFQLAIRHESTQGKELALVVAKGGPKLQPSKDDAGGSPAQPRMMMTGGQLTFQQATLTRLTQFLSQQVHRTVVDRTGLTGKYDFVLKWTPEQGQMMGGPGAGDAPAADGPTIYTALEEQLGLKLEAQKGMIDILTLEHVEKPAEN